MSKIKLTGSNSGYVEISSAADAGNLTLQLPTAGTALLSNAGNVFSGITTTGQLDINGSIDVSSTSVFNDDLTLTGASYNVLWDKSDNQLEFGTNAKLSFGASSDLQIHRSGTHSYIKNSSNTLVFNSDAISFTNYAGNSNRLVTAASGEVKLYYSDSVKLETTNTGAVVTGICTATSFSGSGEGLTRTTQLSHRRMNVNGAMVICQKATSVSGNADNGYPLCTDMVNYRRTGSWSGTTWTVSQNTQTPTALAPFKFFTRWTQAGTVQNAPNDTSTSFQYKIEGQDMAHASWGTSDAKQCTLSFYVRCSQTGTFCVWTHSTDRHYVFEYTISAANTWQRVTHTYTAPVNGQFSTDNNAGIVFHFIIAAHAASGSYGGATTNTWSADGKRWTSNQSTAMSANAGATWDVTGIQFEIGDIATPFEHRSYGEELTRCQRYYEIISPTGGLACWSWASTVGSTNVFWKVRKRTTPSVGYNGTLSNPAGADGTIGVYSHNRGWNAWGTLAMQEPTLDSVRITFGGMEGYTAGDAIGIYFYGQESNIYGAAEL